MKKIYVLAATVLFGHFVQAQFLDFESHPLSNESYDNGSAGGGDFVFSELIFNNVYDTAFMSWDGFAVSNVTDNTTPGWGNQYSAYPGSGADSSSNYLMAYRIPEIKGVGQYETIYSFSITNSTYAALSMRDGDSFAKQFGSPLDASGQPDGTNGEDYFRVWIVGRDDAGVAIDSFVVYLADYRFADSTLDYIVDDWVDINITDSIGYGPNQITFRFESSDVGQFGINTPTYFAIDNVEYGWPLGLTEVEETTISVYPNPVHEILTVKGEQGELIVTDAKGNRVIQQEHNGTSCIDFRALQSGVYFVRLSTDSGVVTKKVIK